VTEDGQELARVSVIDFNSGVDIFDEFVQPPKPVLDYRTQCVALASILGMTCRANMGIDGPVSPPRN
jgi:hypothetical protein